MPEAILKVLSFKKRADNVLEDVFRALFEEIDTDRIRVEVESLRAGAPSFDAVQHARTLARRTAIRCAAAGAVSGLPIGFFGLSALGVDLAYLVYQQFRLVLGIATIYGHNPSARERFTEALSCLAFSGGVGIGKQGIATVLGAEGGFAVEKLGTRVLRDRLGRLVPFIGAVSGGALNYAAVYAVARSAIRYYETQVEPGLAEEIWAEGDREHA